MEILDTISQKFLDFLFHFGPKVLLAILFLVIGFWLIKKMLLGMDKLMSKSKYDITLQRFFHNLTGWTLKIVLLLLVASTLGIDITTFAAIVAAAGLAVGLALQGSLANFAGGVLIMLFKPFKVGDLVEAQGLIGQVKHIDIFNTHLISPDNKLLIIPNASLANGNITNYTFEGKIRVDLEIGVSYNSNIDQVKSSLLNMMAQNQLVLNDPQPFVGVSQYADSSIQCVVRPYCHPNNYWQVYFEVNEGIKKTLDNEKIEIPFPHRVVIEPKK